MESTNGLMGGNMKGNGWIIKCMGREYLLGQMGNCI